MVNLASSKTGFMARVNRLILSKNYKLPINYVASFLSVPEHIDINIKDMNFKKIAYSRAIALDKGYLLPDNRQEVSAFIMYKDKMFKADIRLKGNIPDHWSGDRWSFRIKIKDSGAVLGMKQFSIQHPGTRGGLNEWYYKKLLKENDLIGQRFDFIDVTVNGKRMGIYAVEEHFGKVLIENNRRREGPIVYFNDDYLWEAVAAKDRRGEFRDYSQEAYWAGAVEGYSSKKMKADPELSPLFDKAKYLLESFRRGNVLAGKVFDLEKTARLFAISELCGSLHAHEYVNVKFYYNPISSLLEPIGSDVGDFLKIDHLEGSAEKSKREIFFSTWERHLFEDRLFFREYIKALEEISERSYLDDFFKRTEREAKQKLRIIHRSYPWYVFKDKPILYANQEFIRAALNPIHGLKAYWAEPQDGNAGLTLLLGNVQTMPLEILGVTYRDSASFLPVEETIIQGKKRTSPVDYLTVRFRAQGGFDISKISTANLADLKVKYRVPGSSNIRYEPIFLWPYSAKGADVMKDIPRQNPNVNDFDFLLIDEDTKKIIFRAGKWDLKKNLIIPAGYEVIAGEGLSLNLSDSAKVISYSPLIFCGTEDKRITIYSNNSTGQGIAVFYSRGRSVLKYVNFDNLSNPRQAGWGLTGAVTFYESPVSIAKCSFSNNRGGDDYLNIIRSDYDMTETAFYNSAFDAFDSDFTTGRISRCHFVNSGNDAIDLAGSSADMNDIFVEKAGDKGLSIGERSIATAKSVKIVNAKTAAASKDESELNLKDANVLDCETALAVYQKKEEFGQASMKVEGLRMERTKVPYLVEEGSSLTIDGARIKPTQSKANTHNAQVLLFQRWKDFYYQA